MINVNQKAFTALHTSHTAYFDLGCVQCMYAKYSLVGSSSYV